MAEHVSDGSSLLMGAGLEALIPFAAGYELIRQARRELTIIAPISDMLIDLMVGAGTTRKIVASWVGNVSAGSGYNFRRACEHQDPLAVAVEDHSNLTLALALHAAALGVAFLPTRSVMGTDLLKNNDRLKPTRCPFTQAELVAVEALTPDVAILPVQRTDEHGNAHIWGNLGVIKDGARAAKRVILLAEEIVSPEVIESDPNRTLVPGFLVSAVVHVPMGCHPSPCQGYYDRDDEFFHDYHDATRSREGFVEWLDHWVNGVADQKDYLLRLGSERTASLRDVETIPSAPAFF